MGDEFKDFHRSSKISKSEGMIINSSHFDIPTLPAVLILFKDGLLGSNPRMMFSRVRLRLNRLLLDCFLNNKHDQTHSFCHPHTSPNKKTGKSFKKNINPKKYVDYFPLTNKCHSLSFSIDLNLPLFWPRPSKGLSFSHDTAS